MLYNVEVSFIEILKFISLIVLFTFGLIVFLRIRLQRASQFISSHKGNLDLERKLKNRNKYAELNTFKYTGVLLQYGLIVAILASLTIISWTTTEKLNVDRFVVDDVEKDILDMVDPPIIHTAKPPPPPPIIEPVIDFVENMDDTPDLITKKIYTPVINRDIDTSYYREDTSFNVSLPSPILEKPEEFIDDDIVEVFVEQMPRFPGCEAVIGKKEKIKCAQNLLMEFIYKHTKYPAMAVENRVVGTCVLTFVVDKSGDIRDIELIRDIGAGCGKSAINAIEKMKDMPEKWNPGRQRGRPVNVRYTLPVKFHLQN